jgi:hypothetical protein
MSGNLFHTGTFNFVVESPGAVFTNYQLNRNYGQKTCGAAYCIPYSIFFFCTGSAERNYH